MQLGAYPPFETERGRFGLHRGQAAVYGQVIEDAGWYNKFGTKIGFGDLSSFDIARISCELGEDEAFVAMEKRDSRDAFVTSPLHESTLGELEEYFGIERAGDDDAEIYPGLDYVALKSRVVIVNKRVYFNAERARLFKSLFTSGIDAIPKVLDSVGITLEEVMRRDGQVAHNRLRPQIMPDYDIESYARGLETRILPPYQFARQVVRLSGLVEF